MCPTNAPPAPTPERPTKAPRRPAGSRPLPPEVARSPPASSTARCHNMLQDLSHIMGGPTEFVSRAATPPFPAHALSPSHSFSPMALPSLAALPPCPASRGVCRRSSPRHHNMPSCLPNAEIAAQNGLWQPRNFLGNPTPEPAGPLRGECPGSSHLVCLRPIAWNSATCHRRSIVALSGPVGGLPPSSVSALAGASAASVG